MLFGYSTMGAPELSFRQAGELLEEFGLDFMEIRSLENTLDLPEYFRIRSAATSENKGKVRVVSSSFCLHEAGERSVAELLSYAALADALDAPYVRIFGGGNWGDVPTSEGLEQKAAIVGRVREKFAAEGIRCQLLLETHDAFSCSEYCVALNARLETPLSILWDSHVTWRFAGESPAETWSALGTLISHIHYNDSVSREAEQDGFQYVFPGDGEYPGGDLLALLGREKFCGGISLEWEKLWRPELPDLHRALRKYAGFISRLSVVDSGPNEAEKGGSC